ncbi:MAG: hypothetical protein HOH43_07940, partial [Candidatus Latescibacteria bacterium]|nr:hypothetical protein [Candidatus Latescibacterota bacterium]
ANTSERLLVLVMHELHHVLLGHTTLFETVTNTDNFVFDCVINALVSRMFPDREHISFLTEFYSDKKYPECLLRPPSLWNGRTVEKLPSAIRYLPKGRQMAAEVYRGLYSETGVTYEEIYEILPRLIARVALSGIPLLGGHSKGGSNHGNIETRSPVLFDVVRSIVEEWPQPPDPISGRSLADILRQDTLSTRSIAGNRAVLRALLRKVGGRGTNGQTRRVGNLQIAVPTPVPVIDRRTTVLRALGSEPLFYNGSTEVRRRTPSGDRVHVYVDVSGSMDGIKDAIYGAVNDCREWVHPSVHLFSNSIAEVTRDEIRKGIVRTTGGTDISCIAEHMKNNKVRRACIITDGWVGEPRGGHFATLTKSRLGVAYAGNSINTNDLSGVANHTATLKL